MCLLSDGERERRASEWRLGGLRCRGLKPCPRLPGERDLLILNQLYTSVDAKHICLHLNINVSNGRGGWCCSARNIMLN